VGANGAQVSGLTAREGTGGVPEQSRPHYQSPAPSSSQVFVRCHAARRRDRETDFSWPMIVLSIGGAIYVSALALVSIVAGFAGTPRFQHHLQFSSGHSARSSFPFGS
jgi:hypothetical protein